MERGEKSGGEEVDSEGEGGWEDGQALLSLMLRGWHSGMGWEEGG